ncbi:splicing regulator SDE2 [Lithobates pipiens]
MEVSVVQVWRRDPGNGRLCQAELPQGSTVRELLPLSSLGISCCDFYVTCNGQRVSRDEALQNGFTYSVEPRLCGGKGGFGSMLRALGAQIEKTTNREACRDLSGRRLRDVNHEKAMAEWSKRQAEREAEKEQRRVERLKRKLEEPKHFFTDPEYHKQRSDMSERLEDSVIKGLQASSSTVVSPESSDCCKRNKKTPSGKEKSSKKFLWTGVEGMEVSSSDSDSESPSTSASCQSGEQRLHSSESDSDEQAECSSSTSITTHSPEPSNHINPDEESTGHEQFVSDSGQTEVVDDEAADKGKPVSDPGQIELSEEAIDKGQSVSGSGQAEHSEAIPESEKPTFIPDPPKEPGMDSAPFDLMSFSSAVQLEALGLDKLKMELIALGLKCGGTLQERAARLFSVRGLSKDQIDPALFAKPAKAKKK